MKRVQHISLDLTVVDRDINITRDGEDWAAIHMGSGDTVKSCIVEVINTIFMFETLMP